MCYLSNPRFSCEERHSYRCNVRLLTSTQTHVPLARNDRMIMEYLSDGKIQTHVPLVRNDSSILQNPFPLIHSNPRSSCEERPSASLQHDSAIYNSNPRPSCAERLLKRFYLLFSDLFKPTSLLCGTTCPRRDEQFRFFIQTHVPLVKNDGRISFPDNIMNIQTHVPLVRNDQAAYK